MNIEDVVELSIPVNDQALRAVNYEWYRYHPEKPIERYACSITSLDGKSGDGINFESLRTYNEGKDEVLTEMDFTMRTPHSAPYNYLFDTFDVGRAHYLRLMRTGYFPWHRDAHPAGFRIIHTINNCTSDKLIWILDNKVIELKDNRWYYINTNKKHCLFAFQEAMFAVFNIANNEQNWMTLYKHMVIK